MKRDVQGQFITISAVGEKVLAFVPSPLPPGKTYCLSKLAATEDTAFSCNNKHLTKAAGRYKHCQRVNRPETQSTLCLFPLYRRYESRNCAAIVTFLSHLKAFIDLDSNLKCSFETFCGLFQRIKRSFVPLPCQCSKIHPEHIWPCRTIELSKV